jgi:hypothetical protein
MVHSSIHSCSKSRTSTCRVYGQFIVRANRRRWSCAPYSSKAEPLKGPSLHISTPAKQSRLEICSQASTTDERYHHNVSTLLHRSMENSKFACTSQPTAWAESQTSQGMHVQSSCQYDRMAESREMPQVLIGARSKRILSAYQQCSHHVHDALQS